MGFVKASARCSTTFNNLLCVLVVHTTNYLDQPGASSIAFWSWENLALMSSDLCFWNRDEEDDQQSPHWRKKETIKESRFFHLYFVDSKGCLFFNLVPPFTTFLKEERAQYVFILSFLMLLQREKSTKNKLLKKWQICSNNNKKKSGSKRLTSVTGVVFSTCLEISTLHQLHPIFRRRE